MKNWKSLVLVGSTLALPLIACGAVDDDELETEVDTEETDQSSEALTSSTGYDEETHECYGFDETASVLWTEGTTDRIRFTGLTALQERHASSSAVRGLDYRFEIRTVAGGDVLWSSGTHTTSASGVCYGESIHGCAAGSPNYPLPPFLYAKKSARPYVRVWLGKSGDGMPKCAFNIWPLAPG